MAWHINSASLDFPDSPLEINFEREIKSGNFECVNRGCDEKATKHVEIIDNRDGRTTLYALCQWHAADVFDIHEEEMRIQKENAEADWKWREER